MGLLDTIKNFFETKNKSAEAEIALKAVDAAAQNNNYTQGVVESFYALAKFGEVFKDIKRSDATTAREYVQLLVDEGVTKDGYLEPLVLNFEIAKYSEGSITKEDFAKSYDLLTSVYQELKSGKTAKKPVAKRSKAAASRRRKAAASKRRGTAAGARRRKRVDNK